MVAMVPMATFTCDQIRQAVAKYKNDQTLRDDASLQEAVTALQTHLPPSLGRFLAEVCLIADWGSIRLQIFPFRDRVAMADEINKCWQDVLQPLQSLTETDWVSDAHKDLFEALFQTNLPHPNPQSNRQLVFVSKYLHWCVNPEFAILDSYSLEALGSLGWTENASVQELLAFYKGWMDEIRGHVSVHQSCLMELRPKDRSLVRTLDKALYIIGKRTADIKESEKDGRKLLRQRPILEDKKRWEKWAKAVDKWLVDTAQSLAGNIGGPAVAMFENDAGLANSSYQDVPPEFQKRMDVVNHRLRNLDAIAQQPDAYLAVEG